MAPSAVCPIPTAYSPQQAHAKFLEVKKKMPGLTPAAWRKQAAIEMGLDYDTYLALWKANKGAKGAIKLVPESTPTVPAAASSSPTMGITPKKMVASKPKTLNELMEKPKLKKDEFDQAFGKIAVQFEYGFINVDDLHKVLNELAEKITVGPGGMNVGGATISKQKIIAYKQVNAKTDTATAVGKSEWSPNPDYHIAAQIDQVKHAFKIGNINDDEAFSWLDKLVSDTNVEYYKDKALQAKQLIKPIKSSPTTITATSDIIETAYGPLTHDLASSVYKKMKKDMPGATPATLRHAAADYLGVDYNDYLKAWKKPTTPAQKAKQTTASKLPPNTNTPLSSPTVGKYANKAITEGELKDELARLYGPQANKQFINPSYDEITGEWTVQFSNFLAPTPAAKKAIVEGLEKLGLKVEKQGVYYNIKPITSGKPSASSGAPYKVTRDHTGATVMDVESGNRWTAAWSSRVSAAALRGVKRYTTNAYRTINTDLRKGGKLTGDLKAMSDAMPEVVDPFTVFRGCGDEVGRSLTIDAFEKGELFEDLGFMSTAVTQDRAWRGVRLIIELPKGTKGMYVDHISSARGEMEYLLDAGTKFRVLSVQKGYGLYDGVVRMVAIPK